ncbi:MAG: hypothetical protein RLZZ241_42 [Bacteroidota bacterium]|jgi:two-component system LytT family response regulator
MQIQEISMLKAIIVDDEKNAIQSLLWELKHFEEQVEVLTTFTNANQALLYLSKNSVDCIFLDIDMPQMDGFEFISKLPNNDQIAVVISSAYNQFGIKALKNEAVDYLLKPVDRDDLGTAISKIIKYHSKLLSFNNLEKMVIEATNQTPNKKVTIKADGKLVFLDADEILFAESDGNYTTLFLTDGHKILLTKKLKDVGDLLTSTIFYRIHNSYIINLTHVKEFIQSDGYVILKSNHKIPVSRQKKSDFLDLF